MHNNLIIYNINRKEKTYSNVIYNIKQILLIDTNQKESRDYKI